jgi:hypothetical protein
MLGLNAVPAGDAMPRVDGGQNTSVPTPNFSDPRLNAGTRFTGPRVVAAILRQLPGTSICKSQFSGRSDDGLRRKKYSLERSQRRARIYLMLAACGQLTSIPHNVHKSLRRRKALPDIAISHL